MKYPVFTLFALGLFFLGSCQNNPATTNSNVGAELATNPTNISTVAPAADPKLLSEQILTDFLEAQKESKQYAAAHEANFQLIKNMKMSWGTQGEAEKAHIEKLVKDAMQFYEVYQTHERCTSQLDSLSTNLMAGGIDLGIAQKKYEVIREELKGASSRLQAGQEKMNAVKNEWARDFPALNKLQ